MDANLNFFEGGNSFIPDKLAQDLNNDLEGSWIPFKNWKRLLYTIMTPDRSAADSDLLLDFEQATSAAGAGAAALTFDKIWWRVGSDNTTWGALNFFQLATPVSSLDLDPSAGLPSTQSLPDVAGDINALILHVEFLSERLADGYTHIRASSSESALSAVALISNTFYLASGSAYPRNLPTD